MTTPPALLIAGHGTRDDAGAEAFRAFVRELGRRRPTCPSRAASSNCPRRRWARPSPSWCGGGASIRGRAADAGVRRARQGDIPAALAREKERHPGLTYTYGRPLGPHPSLLRVLERRLAEAVDPSWDPAEVTVLLVGRGSTDPDANAEVFKAARLLWEGRGYAGVETAFVSLAAPDVPSGLDRCARLGARRIVVLPYFLFTGILPDRVRTQTEEWAAAHPDTEVRSADVIGPEPELLDLVLERYEEAVRGDLRMNCDSCVYRIALPGFEDKVGLPQQPHFHPDDDGHHHHGHGHAHSHSHAH